MLWSQGPFSLPQRALWPFHQALVRLKARAEEDGVAGKLPRLTFKPDADVGLVEETAVLSLYELIDRGVLCHEGEGWEAAIRVAEAARLRPYRRMLMGLPTEVAEVIYDAGSNWAARAFTAEKKWKRAVASLADRRASGAPKRRHDPPGAVC